jgi:hypothetical protein
MATKGLRNSDFLRESRYSWTKGGRKSGISLDSRSKGYEPVPGYSTFSAERNRSFSGSTAVSVNDGNTVINIPQVLRNSSKS